MWLKLLNVCFFKSDQVPHPSTMPRVRSMLLQDPDGEGVSEMVVMVNRVSDGKGARDTVVPKDWWYQIRLLSAFLKIPSDLRLS